MRQFGFPQGFIDMTRMLSEDATTSVKVNGSISTPFAIRRGVHHGCVLAPYIFLIAAEVMNAMVKVEVETGRVKGIKLPIENLQQVMA
jgi:hypothetical protein